MLPLAHLGIGSKLASPWSKDLPKWALLTGTMLPDLIDKPLYYGLSFVTDKHGAGLGLISCTRTLGHTAILLLGITLLAAARNSRLLAALALGVATHLLLDNLSDSLSDYFVHDIDRIHQHSALLALLWPFYTHYFATSPFKNLAGHMDASFSPISLGGELLGAAIHRGITGNPATRRRSWSSSSSDAVARKCKSEGSRKIPEGARSPPPVKRFSTPATLGCGL